MIVRKAIARDFAEILEIENACFDEPWNEKMFREELEADAASFFVLAGGDGEIVSYLSVRTVCGEGEILRIATKPEKQKHGFAAVLLKYVLDDLAARNVKTLYLEVRADNISAKRLYEKFAFRRIAVREKYYGGKYDAEIYKLRVGS